MKAGESIGPYVVRGPLGSGGMGHVYLAHDARLGREVALKQLSDPRLTSDAVRQRVLHEARAAARLSHPNIATIYDVIDTAAGPTIVMEYVAGESLAAALARGPLPVGRALEIARAIADGLTAAHAHGIIHRDLKPANVQIAQDDTVKILDFGIAQDRTPDPTASATPTHTAGWEYARGAGTPGYMAPEQIDRGISDARTDVYALGVMLYEMLAGRRPYTATDPIALAIAAVQGGAPPLSEAAPGTPAHVSELVARAMARNPDDRYQSASALARDLQRAQHLHDTSSTALPQRTSRAWPRAALRGVVAIAAIAAVAAMGWYFSDRAVSDETAVFAVLPFSGQAGDATDAMAPGLTDAVATSLSALPSLRLVSVDTAREAAAEAPDAAAAARALGARFVVDAMLSRSGDTVDVAVALVDADGQRTPAGQYRGTVTGALDLQRQIAQGVLKTLARTHAVRTPSSLPPGPTTSQDAFAEYAQARLFLERPDVTGNVDHAIRLFQAAIDRDPNFALAYAGLGQAYWARYEQTQDLVWTTRANTAILDALRIAPNRPEVRLSLAVMYQGVGRLDDAEDELERAIAAQPENDDAWRQLAGVEIDRGRWNEAVHHLTRAIALRPNYWRNHSELGYAHFRAGRATDAIAAYRRVVELQPDSALGYHMLGTVQQSVGLRSEALGNYSAANAIRPRATTSSNIGTLYFWDGNYAKAAEAYRYAVKMAPNTPGLHVNLGDALHARGDAPRARESYRRAVELLRAQQAVNDKDAANLSMLGISLAKLGEQAEADASIFRARELNPDDAEVLYAAAVVAALGDRPDDACATLTRALERGTSVEIVRHAPEFQPLANCAAYKKIAVKSGTPKGAGR